MPVAHNNYPAYLAIVQELLDEVTITLVYSLVTISSSSFIGTGGDGKVATGPSGSSAPGGNCGAVSGGEGATGTTGLENAAPSTVGPPCD